MNEENISQEFKLKNLDEIRNHFIEKINQNELVSKKSKNVCEVPNYIKYLLTLVPKISGWVSISAFASLGGIPKGMTTSAVTWKMCVKIPEIKTYEPIIKIK